MATLTPPSTGRFNGHYDRDVDIAWIRFAAYNGKTAVSSEQPWGLEERDPKTDSVVAVEIWRASKTLPNALLSLLPPPGENEPAPSLAQPDGPDQARTWRSRAAERYRPERVRLLLVAEAPPTAPDRYFYFDAVREHDALFRYVTKTVLGVDPDRETKRNQLRRLKDCGVFLIDLTADPLIAGENLDAHVPSLVARATALSPEHVIVIKAGVFDRVYEPLCKAGLPVVDERIPFPASGQQRRFESAMKRALRRVNWRCDAAA